MSVINAVPLLAAAGGDYTISRSVRLRSSASAYFNRTPGSTTNQTTWTYSAWIKRGALSTGEFISASDSTGGTNFDSIDVNSDTFRVYFNGTSSAFLVTTAVYRDPSAWYHLVVSVDTTQATASNRIKMYVNGVQVTSFSTSTYPSQNYATFFNLNGRKNTIGANAQTSPGQFFDGYFTEINFIDGQALTPSSFGETDVITGVWKPKKYTSTYGTNGFYLNFSDNSNNTAATIGKDYSGNGNNWTPNNISVTSGSTYDSMLDVPTPYADGGNGRGNYAVLNPLLDWKTNGSAFTLSEGNLRVTEPAGTTYGSVASTIAMPSGKWYCEFTVIAASGVALVGVTSIDSAAGFPGQTASSYAYHQDGRKFNNNTGSSYGATYTTNDVIGIAFDADSGSVTFYKNGTSQGTAFSSISAGSYYFVVGDFSNSVSTFVANFGQRPFTYTPPSGFVALNTQNLPEPTIKNGKQNFDVLTYAGSASSQTISGLNFQPDLIWFKERTTAGIDHFLVDSVRSSYGLRLYSNSTAAEASTSAVTSVTSTGYTLAGGASNTNDAFGRTYVAWNWKESATAGFDIVTYTGNGASGRDIAHSLGVKPSMIITKARTDATYNWHVWHTGIGADYYISLNTTAARDNSVNVFPYAGITSSSFRTSTAGVAYNNLNAVTYVAYLFAEVAGFSKFGSYTGNGSSTDGPFVYLGFRPRWIMVKSSTSVTDWKLLDTSRNPYNSTNSLLGANISAAEDTNTAYDFDILSNGFKIRNAFSYANTNGATYIYACFAENPFKLALAR